VESDPGSIGATDGVFTWTANTVGSFPVTVRVTDNGSPVLFAEETFRIDVTAVNNDPVIAAVPVLDWDENTGNVQPINVTDPDSDPVTLGFAVSPPSGVSLDGTVLAWTPSESQGPGAYTVDLVGPTRQPSRSTFSR